MWIEQQIEFWSTRYPYRWCNDSQYEWCCCDLPDGHKEPPCVYQGRT